MRIALGVEYQGAGFQGWQRQKRGRSVQQCVESALSKVADHEVETHCAGRTDAGVHARHQVVHFDTLASRTPRSWVLGTNVNLPFDVNLLWAQEVRPNFHARYSAQARTYRYQIINRCVRSALWHQRATWCHQPLDADLMRQAGQALIGEHDFSSYRAQGCQSKSPVRRVTRLDVRREGEMLMIEICANAFLHHMVRNIAGVLMTIGRGERPLDWAGEILAQRNRTKGGVTAPPDGLYLLGVDYPDIWGLPDWRQSLDRLGPL